jgi:hypothetical protein
VTGPEDSEAKAREQRLERLRRGYRSWLGEADPEDLPDIELTPEGIRRIGEALSFGDPSADPLGTEGSGRRGRRPR